MSKFEQSIAEFIWDIKYRYRLHDQIIDHSIEQTWQRVAYFIARAEKTASLQKTWQQQFYNILEDFYFLPGGRILAGAGTAHHVTLCNCFVMGAVPDNLPGIFKSLTEGALTLQQGGGVGYDFSTLRPNGLQTHHNGAIASGPVSFMRIWDSMCSTIQSTGVRRGAMMGILRCDHPDILEFIHAKEDPSQLRHFNVSVLITDEFMQAVDEDLEWPLVFPASRKDKKNKEMMIQRRWSGQENKIDCRVYHHIKARQLWEKIIQSAYNYAEPGVLFEDTINRMNNLNYCEWISATNPCGEIPLPPYGACNLGSLNLTKFVLNPFSEKAELNWDKLIKVTTIACRFLDNVIDQSRYPLKKQQLQTKATRRIGLGFTGFADMLVMLGIRYGSKESTQLAAEVMKKIADTSWQASISLAEEKKSFPLFEAKKYLEGNFVKTLPSHIFNDIEKIGIRNSHHNAIAPTGTISLLANNISSGIEPIFQKKFERKVRNKDNDFQQFTVEDYAYYHWRLLGKESELPPAWIDAQQLTVNEHLQIQAAVQPYVDAAISKTIFVPEDISFSSLQEVYAKAYQLEFKGCTVFRPNKITGSVIQTAVEPQSPTECY